MGVPANKNTEFGDIFELACYYYLWAMINPPTEMEIINLANNWDLAARRTLANNEGTHYNETPENQRCEELFE